MPVSLNNIIVVNNIYYINYVKTLVYKEEWAKWAIFSISKKIFFTRLNIGFRKKEYRNSHISVYFSLFINIGSAI